MPAEADFEELVNCHYSALYRFALSLTRSENDAADLTQQTFYIWARKGSQLLDASKAKSWLFTTLHREFLQKRRKGQRYPEQEWTEVQHELPPVPPNSDRHTDAAIVLESLGKMDATYHSAVALFYLEDFSYLEIAQVLNIPLGTVKSRIARGIAQLQRLLADQRSPRKDRP